MGIRPRCSGSLLCKIYGELFQKAGREQKMLRGGRRQKARPPVNGARSGRRIEKGCCERREYCWRVCWRLVPRSGRRRSLSFPCSRGTGRTKLREANPHYAKRTRCRVPASCSFGVTGETVRRLSILSGLWQGDWLNVHVS